MIAIITCRSISLARRFRLGSLSTRCCRCCAGSGESVEGESESKQISCCQLWCWWRCIMATAWPACNGGEHALPKGTKYRRRPCVWWHFGSPNWWPSAPEVSSLFALAKNNGLFLELASSATQRNNNGERNWKIDEN